MAQNQNLRLLLLLMQLSSRCLLINSDNEKDGFEVDLIKEVARDAGLKYELINVEWGGLFAGFDHKEI